jgi:hypothetical protein
MIVNIRVEAIEIHGRVRLSPRVGTDPASATVWNALTPRPAAATWGSAQEGSSREDGSGLRGERDLLSWWTLAGLRLGVHRGWVIAIVVCRNRAGTGHPRGSQPRMMTLQQAAMTVSASNTPAVTFSLRVDLHSVTNIGVRSGQSVRWDIGAKGGEVRGVWSSSRRFVA